MASLHSGKHQRYKYQNSKSFLPLFFVVILLVPTFSGCLDVDKHAIKSYIPSYGLTVHRINDNLTYGHKYLTDLGIKVIRYDIEWSELQPSQNTTNQQYILECYNNAYFYASNGYEQIVVFWHPPEWTYNLSKSDFIVAYINALTKINSILPLITILQIGNEPNNPIHSQIFADWTAADLREFYHEVSNYIHTNYPSLKTAVNIQITYGWKLFMDNTFKPNHPSLVNPNIDILAVDYYPGVWNAGGTIWNEIRVYLELLDSYVIYEGSIFETGYPTPSLNPTALSEQKHFYADMVPDLIDLLTQYNYKFTSKSVIQYLIFYALQDKGDSTLNPERNFGLIVLTNPSGKPYYKPAYNVVKDIVNNYIPPLFGSGVRLPFYGYFIGFTPYALYFVIVFIISYVVAYITREGMKGEYLSKQKVAQIENNKIWALTFASTMTAITIILALIPFNIIWLLFIIPPLLYIIYRNTIMSLSALIVVIGIAILQVFWFMAGIAVL